MALKIVSKSLPFCYAISATSLASGGKQQDVNVYNIVIAAK